MERCANCKRELVHKKLKDFGQMVFIECPECGIIWDYIPGIRTQGVLSDDTGGQNWYMQIGSNTESRGGARRKGKKPEGAMIL